MAQSVKHISKYILNVSCKHKSTADEANDFLQQIVSYIIVNKSVGHVPFVLHQATLGLESTNHFASKLKALDVIDEIMSSFKDEYPLVVKNNIPILINGIYGTLVDVKKVVVEKGKRVLHDVCQMINNKDINDVIPSVIEAISNPLLVQNCIHQLASTTFVQTVEAPTLSLLVPLLLRGLRERSTAIKRKSALIIENMSKLVEVPNEAKVFLPRLLPELEKIESEVADPDCRTVVSRTIQVLRKLEHECTLDEMINIRYDDAIIKHMQVEDTEDIEYMKVLISSLTSIHEHNISKWEACFGDWITSSIEEFMEDCLEEVRKNNNEVLKDNDDDEGQDICNCEFSLAYGAKILLNNATLQIKRGRRYGLCGPNGAGKSTLLRAIDNGQVDGFPQKHEVCTIFVEHDIDGSQSTTSVFEFIQNDSQLIEVYSHRHQEMTEMFIRETLSEFGFGIDLQQSPISSLSGGWKMKLALARAVLMKADILLLDEPTNHLDSKNVAWLTNYLNGLTDASSIIVSHDTHFLDNVCTDIIHYNNRKLTNYRGNLSKFVEKVEEGRSYYELGATQYTFHFPEPGFLEGVKTKDKAILKMDKVAYKYPNTDKNVLNKASVYVALNSRVGCVGANGAGKSTLIKLLTGEIEPTEGTVWKHPNLRIAYVAQHAFDHIQYHLDKTPVEYIQWRFAPGEDREAHTKATRQVSEEEQRAMAVAKTLAPDGVQRKIEKILCRRKLRKDYEYEVQWVGLSQDKTSWLPRSTLEELGFTKMVNEIDIKEAANQGFYLKPLTTANIQKHLDDLGLDREISTHNHIRGLSGGQKVKVVLGACTWLQPHIIVLDEPTNYLDRDSLGALAGAIKNFGGGIVVISHNEEFIKTVSIETWRVGDGQVVVDNPFANIVKPKEKIEFNVQEEMTDSLGNTIKIKAPKKTMSNKEKKALAKLRKARRERGEIVTDSEEDY